MTGYRMTVLEWGQVGLCFFAAWFGDWTTICESTSNRWVDRVGRVAGYQDTFGGFSPLFVDGWNSRQQRLGVGVLRIVEQALAVRMFDDLAHIHNSDGIAHVLNDTEIVRNEKECQAPFLLEPTQKI